MPMGRLKIKKAEIKTVPRTGRKLVGISADHHRRLTRLRFTNRGEISFASVLATLLEKVLTETERELGKEMDNE